MTPATRRGRWLLVEGSSVTHWAVETLGSPPRVLCSLVGADPVDFVHVPHLPLCRTCCAKSLALDAAAQAAATLDPDSIPKLEALLDPKRAHPRWRCVQCPPESWCYWHAYSMLPWHKLLPALHRRGRGDLVWKLKMDPTNVDEVVAVLAEHEATT